MAFLPLVASTTPRDASPMSTDAAPPTPDAASFVTAIAPAPPGEAQAHFEQLLAYETDCWDVHASMAGGTPDFVLLHVSGDRAGFDAGHVPGATYLPHATMTVETLSPYPADTVFVVYCAGPHCNAADKAAARLAALGRPVKKMIGGRIGWLDEGFELESA